MSEDGPPKCPNILTTDQIKGRLSAVGEQLPQDIEIAQAAVYLAALSHSGKSLDCYFHHLDKMHTNVVEQYEKILNAGADDDVYTRLAVLKEVLCLQMGYQGDIDHYNNLENADLIRVVDRRKGLPVSLCILYIDVARRMNWQVEGLNFPVHFLLKITYQGQQEIFDPFYGCRILQANDLRSLIKDGIGEHAELSSDFYKPIDSREILLRLQNNVKFRQIELEAYEDALLTVQAMQRIAPDDNRLNLDAGVLYARTEKLDKAEETLMQYIELASDINDRAEAQLLLQNIRDGLL